MEKAIHFLYGQLPRITVDNADGIFEVAEFLMIEELKAYCMGKIKAIEVNVENCLQLFLLSNRYEFCLQHVQEFISSHLTELLPRNEMLMLEKETVRYIISDSVLSYVSREDCFRFLLHWTSYHSSRQSDFAELFSCFDADDLSPDFLNTVGLDFLSQSDRLACSNVLRNSNAFCDVLVVYPPSNNAFSIYHLKKKIWSQITIPVGYISWPTYSVALKNQTTIARLSYYAKRISYYDIENKLQCTKTVQLKGTEEEVIRQGSVRLSSGHGRLYCVENYITDAGTFDKEHRSHNIVYGKRPTYYDYNAAPQQVLSTRKRKQFINACSIYVAEKEDDLNVHKEPLISVYGYATSFCIAGEFACLLMSEEEELIIYALNESIISPIDLSAYTTSSNSCVSPCPTGGLYVVTGADIIQIDIQIKDHFVISRIVDTLTEVKKEEESEIRRRNAYSPQYEMNAYSPRYEIVEDKIITRCMASNEKKLFYQMLPKQIGLLDKEESIEIMVPDHLKHGRCEHFVQMKLSTNSPTCHVDCPHCKPKAKYHKYPVCQPINQSYTRDYDSDEYDSDECHHFDDDYYDPDPYYESNDYYVSDDDWW